MLCHNYFSVSNAYNEWQTLTVIWKADTTTIKKRKKRKEKGIKKMKTEKLDWVPHPPGKCGPYFSFFIIFFFQWLFLFLFLRFSGFVHSQLNFNNIYNCLYSFSPFFLYLPLSLSLSFKNQPAVTVTIFLP